MSPSAVTGYGGDHVNRAPRAPHPARLACLALLAVVASLLLPGCKTTPKWERGKKYFHYPLRAKVGSLDPVTSDSQYDNVAISPVYETLFEYEYLVRPYRLKPLLLAKMPEVSEDKLTYSFELKRGVLFHDDPCFPNGIGRELVAQDIVYSLKRMADRSLSPSGWWLYKSRIKGFDAFKKRMDERPRGAPFAWDGEVEGLKVLDEHRLQIVLTRPFPQFLNVLAMGYTAAVPRECAEKYGKDFGNKAIGTGPFVLEEWVRGSHIRYRKNPKYRKAYYPTEATEEFKRRGLLAPAGKQIPFLDGIVYHVFEQDQPKWLKFRVGDLDATQVPAEYFPLIYHKDKTLKQEFIDQGMGYYNVELLDFIYRGFNYEDPVLGGQKGKKLRQAIYLATDMSEFNDAFYNSTNKLYDGPIPPGLDGYDPKLKSPYRGPNLAKAKQLLAEAGYPEGKGLTLYFHTSQGGNIGQQAELFVRQMKQVGIQVEVELTSFPELQDKMRRKKAQVFSLAWGADYPDAENFLQLFYGPNKTPGSNKFNYDNPKFNELFAEASVMQPGPERTKLYVQLRDMVIEDAPAIGSMARTRFYVWNTKRLKYFQPSETWYRWMKYVDVEAKN